MFARPKTAFDFIRCGVFASALTVLIFWSAPHSASASDHRQKNDFQRSTGLKEQRVVQLQNGTAVVGPNIQIHPNPAMQQFEVSITTHPLSPDTVLVAAVTQDPLSVSANAGTMGWYYSTDGGATWSGQDTLPTHINLNEWMGDPAVGIDLNGNLFVGGIYNDAYIFVDRSTNDGVTWTHATAYSTPGPGQGHRPHLAIDTDPSSPYQEYLYIASEGGRFSRSTDGGQTFPILRSFAGTIGSWRVGAPHLAVSPDTELYATWAGFDSPSSAPVRLGFNKSTDGGASWGTAKSIQSYNGVYPTITKGPHTTLIYSAPSIAVDRGTGARRGWVYIVYDEKSPTTPDVFLIRSTDGGDSWSSRVKVNQDNSGTDQWMSWISVDPSTGALFVVYYDSRNFPANDSAEVYISASLNGGETFEDILVSDVPFVPAPIRAPWDNDDYMGQYIGICALRGVVWPCWMDNRTGFHQVYTSKVDCNIDSDGDGTADCFDGCPLDADKTSPGVCGCGVADTDSDGDGFTDCFDNCPSTPNPGQSDADLDGHGDACDNCLQVANPNQAVTITMTGDVNVSGSITSSDIISEVNYVFKGGVAPLPCVAAGDVNCNGNITSADVIALVNFVFKSGLAPCNVCLAAGLGWSCP